MQGLVFSDHHLEGKALGPVLLVVFSQEVPQRTQCPVAGGTPKGLETPCGVGMSGRAVGKPCCSAPFSSQWCLREL